MEPDENPSPGDPAFYEDFSRVRPEAVPGMEEWMPTFLGYAMWITIPCAIIAFGAAGVLMMLGNFGRGMTSADGMRRLFWAALGVGVVNMTLSIVGGLYGADL